MIRIGSSCALSIPMVIGYVAETRILTDCSSHWEEVARYCIDNDIYLIVTPCINDGYNHAKIPSDEEWAKLIANTCSYLKSIGANHNNTRLSIINEPMKFCTKEKYAELINMAVPITHSYGFKVGAGNEEFITAQARGNMYQYILANSNFDILDIHIQGSCDSKEKIEYWTNTARSWTKKPIDCTEAFYGNVATQYDLLVTQMENAERIGCDNFCNVFNNLDTSVFPILKNQQVLSKWTELSFKVNGILRTDKFWEWKRLMSSKAPIPNIKKGVLGGMIIKTIGHKTTDVKSGYGVELLHELLLYKGYMNEDDIENKYVYDEETRKAVESFQADLKINVDGRVGRQTWRKFISSIEDSTVKKDFQFNLEVVMSPYNANGDT